MMIPYKWIQGQFEKNFLDMPFIAGAVANPVTRLIGGLPPWMLVGIPVNFVNGFTGGSAPIIMGGLAGYIVAITDGTQAGGLKGTGGALLVDTLAFPRRSPNAVIPNILLPNV